MAVILILMNFAAEHQKVVIALIAGATIISMSGIFAYFQKTDVNTNEKTVTPPTQKTVTDSGDADGDGAPDWQEILYGTDTNQKDTDGDGVDDMTEIDEIKKERQQGFIDAISGNTPAGTTTTELTADRLVGAYILQEQANKGEVTKKEQEAIVKSTIQKLSELKYPTHTIEEIPKQTITSKKTILTYREQVRVALAPLKEVPEYELQIYARAVDKNDQKDFETLARVAKIYSAVAKKLLDIETPNEIAQNHVDFINGLSYTSVALEGMSKGYDDVIGSYRALGHFGKAERQLKMAQEALRVYFTVNDIEIL